MEQRGPRCGSEPDRAMQRHGLTAAPRHAPVRDGVRHERGVARCESRGAAVQVGIPLAIGPRRIVQCQSSQALAHVIRELAPLQARERPLLFGRGTRLCRSGRKC